MDGTNQGAGWPARIGVSLGLLALFAVIVMASARLILFVRGPFATSQGAAVVQSTGPEGERNQAIFRQLIIAQNLAKRSRDPKALSILHRRVCDYFKISEETMRDIWFTGNDTDWPMPRQGELFLPVPVAEVPGTPPRGQDTERESYSETAAAEGDFVADSGDGGGTSESGGKPAQQGPLEALGAAARVALNAVQPAFGAENAAKPAFAHKAGDDVFPGRQVRIHWHFRLRDPYLLFKRDCLTPADSRIRVLRVERPAGRYWVDVFSPQEESSIGQGWVLAGDL